mmetsp:Transcript_67482/g.108689  ORF Transcript_67482/g.108689 Transcript_67482/m.108689 type:complete len:177 (-) Transcript_67482:212-742(-)
MGRCRQRLQAPEILPPHEGRLFFFNEYKESIASEYPVTVTARGSRASPTECVLVVHRAQLHHRAPRGTGSSSGFEKDHKKASFMPPLLKKLGRHLSLPEAFKSENNIFIERCVHDIRDISQEGDANPRSFSVTYSGSTASGGVPGEAIEFTYQAQTPTECAEIVARLHFLLMLLAR